ncbi:MAG: Ig-like domain-containing protein [Elusimicrobiota bacterium]
MKRTICRNLVLQFISISFHLFLSISVSYSAETLASKILNIGGSLKQSLGISFTDSIGEDFTTACSSHSTQFFAGYIYTIFFDTVPSVSTLEISEPNYNLGDKIVVTDKTIFTLSARDPVVWGVSSGVKETRWRIADGGWQIYTLPFTLHELPDGNYTVQYYSVDRLNNTEKVKTITAVIDNTAPVVEILSPSKDNYGVCKIINGQVSIYGSATDKHLKYYEVAYSQLNSSVSVVISREYKEVSEGVLAVWDTTQLAEGWYTLKLVAQDYVKNESSTSVDVYIGKPELLLTVDGFNKPSYIVLDSTGNMYISDTNNDSIKKFDRDGHFVLEISTQVKVADTSARAKRVASVSEKIFNKPTGIAVSSQGNMYIADRNNDRIVRIKQIGDRRWDMGDEITGFNKPHGIFI